MEDVKIILGLIVCVVIACAVILAIFLSKVSNLTPTESALVDKHFTQWNIERYVVEKEEWIELVEGEYPTGEVVLVACDTSDCGWTIEACWWSEENDCWCIAGCNGLFIAHLPYTHYRKLPSSPKSK